MPHALTKRVKVSHVPIEMVHGLKVVQRRPEGEKKELRLSVAMIVTYILEKDQELRRLRVASGLTEEAYGIQARVDT